MKWWLYLRLGASVMQSHPLLVCVLESTSWAQCSVRYQWRSGLFQWFDGLGTASSFTATHYAYLTRDLVSLADILRCVVKAFWLVGTSSQLALVVKKKQYERVMT